MKKKDEDGLTQDDRDALEAIDVVFFRHIGQQGRNSQQAPQFR